MVKNMGFSPQSKQKNVLLKLPNIFYYLMHTFFQIFNNGFEERLGFFISLMELCSLKYHSPNSEQFQRNKNCKNARKKHNPCFLPTLADLCKGGKGKMTLGLIYKSSGEITPNWHNSSLTYRDKGINHSLAVNMVFEMTNLSTMNIIKRQGNKSMDTSLFINI